MSKIFLVRNSLTETNRLPQIKKIGRRDQRTYVSRYISYAKRVAAETDRGDSIVPTRKRQDETHDVEIESKKGKEEKKNKINQQQERKKEDTLVPGSYYRE